MISRLFIVLVLCFSMLGRCLASREDEKMLLDYYNGDVELSDYSAGMVVGIVNDAPSNDYYKALSYYVMGVMKDKRNDVNCVIDFYDAIRLLETADTTDLFIEVQARKNIGVYMMERGHLNEALRLYETAIDFARKYKRSEVFSLKYNIGNVYNKASHQRALEYYQEVEDFALSVSDKKKLTQVYLQKGIYWSRKNADSSFFYFNKALASGKDLPKRHEKYLGKAYQGLANLAMIEQDYRGVLEYLRSGVVYQEDRIQFIANLDLGRAHWELGEVNEAKAALNKALGEVRSVNIKQNVVALFSLLEVVYGDDPESLEQFRELELTLFRLYVNEAESLSRINEELVFDQIIKERQSENSMRVLEGWVRYTDLVVYFISAMICLFVALVWIMLDLRRRRIKAALDANDRQVGESLGRE